MDRHIGIIRRFEEFVVAGTGSNDDGLIYECATIVSINIFEFKG